MKGTNSSF